MIYLDNAATTLYKPRAVHEAVRYAMTHYANPGRGGHRAAEEAAQAVFHTRVLAAELFDCAPEQVCFTSNATHGLNLAIRSLLRPGDRVVISGLEHNAVTRTLTALHTEIVPVRAPLFSAGEWVDAFSRALTPQTRAAVCLQASNVFGCVLPVDEIAAICTARKIPLIVDASQSAGTLPVSVRRWGAAFVAMPGHKGLLGPQGTGLLLCSHAAEPLLTGGTGSLSMEQQMPEELPDRLEAGTLNVPGICGLYAGMKYLSGLSRPQVLQRERRMLSVCAQELKKRGAKVFTGEEQIGVLSFIVLGKDVEELAERYGANDVALRAGLHCAPLAHQTAGTAPEGTLRISFSPLTTWQEVEGFLSVTKRLL